MDIYWWRSQHGNFGDDMNGWFWESAIPGLGSWSRPETIFGIGTLLNDESLGQFPKIVVLGSGVGYGDMKQADGYPSVDIRFVRGPVSASRLGLDPRQGIADPAILTPELLRFDAPGSGEVLFVPHHSTEDIGLPWQRWCHEVDVAYQSPCADSTHVIRRIAASRLIIAESMHAAIIADAYRVPWVSTAISTKFHAEKWLDWCGSLDQPFVCVDRFLRARQLYSNIKQRLAKLRGITMGSGGQGSADRTRLPAAGPLVTRVSWLSRQLFHLSLREAVRMKPSLSDDRRLIIRQRELRDALDSFADDYRPR